MNATAVTLASLENMLSIEASLLELRLKAKMFQDSAGFLCRTMNDQAVCYSRLCKGHATLGTSTTSYAAVTKTALQENAFNRLRDALELKVYEPIKVNLMVLSDIKARAHERDALRRRSKPMTSKGPPGSASSEFASLTARLFDELAALQHHRFDFVRGLYEGLKTAQRRFFQDISNALESPDLDVVSLVKSPATVPAAVTTQDKLSRIDDDSYPMSPSAKPTAPPPTVKAAPIVPLSSFTQPSSTIIREVAVTDRIVATFDPLADQVSDSTAPAFARFKEKDSPVASMEAFGFSDDEEEEAWSSKVSTIKLPPATKPTTLRAGKQKPAVRNRNVADDDDDDGDFETV